MKLKILGRIGWREKEGIVKMKIDLKKYKTVGKVGKVEMIAPKKYPKNHNGIFQCYWKVKFPNTLLVLKIIKSDKKQMNFKILKMVKIK